LQYIDRTWLGPKYQTPSTLYVLSCATDGGSDWFLMCPLNTAVFVAIDGRNNNRCDSNVSLFRTFCISSGHVSSSPILTSNQILLHTHCSPSHLGEPDSPHVQKDERLALRTKDSSVIRKPSTRITVHRAYHGEHPMSKTNHYGDGSYPSLDAQLTEKLHELISDDDVEGRIEKK
jgi:hypothetical protein